MNSLHKSLALCGIWLAVGLCGLNSGLASVFVGFMATFVSVCMLSSPE